MGANQEKLLIIARYNPRVQNHFKHGNQYQYKTEITDERMQNLVGGTSVIRRTSQRIRNTLISKFRLKQKANALTNKSKDKYSFVHILWCTMVNAHLIAQFLCYFHYCGARLLSSILYTQKKLGAKVKLS